MFETGAGAPRTLTLRIPYPAEKDIRKVFQPRWASFPERTNLYRVIFNGKNIPGVHWQDVDHILTDAAARGYPPGTLMNLLRLTGKIHPGESFHRTYGTIMHGTNEGYLADLVHLRELYPEVFQDLGNTQLNRAARYNGVLPADYEALDRALQNSQNIYSNGYTGGLLDLNGNPINRGKLGVKPDSLGSGSMGPVSPEFYETNNARMADIEAKRKARIRSTKPKERK